MFNPEKNVQISDFCKLSRFQGVVLYMHKWIEFLGQPNVSQCLNFRGRVYMYMYMNSSVWDSQMCPVHQGVPISEVS